MASLSLVSLNIERDKHLDLVIPFLREHPADIVCIQELFGRDIPALEEALSAKCFFAPSTLYPTLEGPIPEGVAIFSRHPVSDVSIVPYAGREGDLVVFAEEKSPEAKVKTQKYELLTGVVEKDGARFRVATTHFVWTPDGEADDTQRAAVERMLAEIRNLGETILCGDLNAPRGKEIFARIESEMKDNIPAQYETSIDGAIHRAGPLPVMVDGLFTTPGYAASDVSLVSGVSDHCAITATIEEAV
jgi:endonuclease/exonuclease/phosphatase family metal-dependent hydrolase